jgi:RimJ/RimL family protein N-acetyltransferase
VTRSPGEIRTQRLILRPWRDDDLAPFAAMNADPRVMEFFPAPLSRDESDASAGRIRAHFDAHGFGLWAIEVPGRSSFIGFTGLMPPRFEAHFTPAIEIGWRLAFEHWGQGYATEAARAVLAHGFETLGLAEIVSFTAVGNVRSRQVMEKIGMRHDARGDFDHPLIAEGHPLRPHVLYRVARPR